MNPGMYTSAKDDYPTPWPLFRRLEAKYGPFDLDAAAQPWNAKVPRFYTPADDGLAQPWYGRVWLNPPYGDVIGRWVAKARHEAHVLRRALVVCLLPGRSDAAWYHAHVEHEEYGQLADEIVRLRGKVKFEGTRNSAPFPSIVVVYRPDGEAARRSASLPWPEVA